MAAVRWLAVAVAVAVAVGVPGRVGACWRSPVCSDLSDEARALNCIHYCLSVTQAAFPELTPADQRVVSDDDDDDDDDDDGDLLLSIILALLTSDDKATEADPHARRDQRRSYTMEHFRWGKPPGDRPKQRAPGHTRRSYPAEPLRRGGPSGGQIAALKGRRDGRRSYTMEHFRWGKPPGRKRVPLEARDPVGRRQVRQRKRARGRAKSHFRWGGSSASRRSSGGTELLVDVLRAVRLGVKDAERRMGQMKREEEEEGGVVG
ncbi:pro-opiomelanocortin-like isoform X2 [Betta splendens]|uniref:Pro-opiomelanocortin-like isoform X2 n=1 Tax=Betta splendens TaxID=158456 RepID=A0A6P7LQJ2_BETSP|nr:pro-opiomelanocortin-like isoform X2 [Betta splendens]